MRKQGVLKKIFILGLLLLANSNSVVLAYDESVNKSDDQTLSNQQQNTLTREQQSDKLYSLFTKVIGTQNPEDQYRLGKMFQFGDGVQKDDIQAYVWTALSLTNGYPGATKTLRDLESTMSTYEVDYAIELLRKIRELR